MRDTFQFTCPHCFTGFDDIVYTAFRCSNDRSKYLITWAYEGVQTEDYTAEKVEGFIKEGLWKVIE